MTATLEQAPFAGLAAQAIADSATDGCGVGVREAREAAFARFAALGIPTSKDEEWRFTSVRHLGSTPFGAAATSSRLDEGQIAPFLIDPGSFRVVVVDGRVDLALSRLSSTAAVRLVSLAATTADASAAISCAGDSATALVTPFAALNAALWTGGAMLSIGAGAVVADSIEILHITTAAAANAVITPRLAIYVAPNASAHVVESYVSLGADSYFTNTACEIVLDDGARLEHTRIQRENKAATHIGVTSVRQAASSHYRSVSLCLGGKLARHDLQARHEGAGVETLLYGLYLARGEQVVDNHTAIFHDHPNCNSWEVYKGVLADKAHGVFNGKVLVKPEAQKTDAKQTNRNLLLSDAARVDTKPQLEIFADDVKCTHGATVGKLNEQQRFYLRTRGIAGREAEMMLITAFVSEVLEESTRPAVRDTLKALVAAELSGMIG